MSKEQVLGTALVAVVLFIIVVLLTAYSVHWSNPRPVEAVETFPTITELLTRGGDVALSDGALTRIYLNGHMYQCNSRMNECYRVKEWPSAE